MAVKKTSEKPVVENDHFCLHCGEPLDSSQGDRCAECEGYLEQKDDDEDWDDDSDVEDDSDLDDEEE